MILSGDFEEQMQSSHSPSVALRLCCAPEDQCLLQGNFTHVWCLICMAGAPVFAASNQETSLNCLALVVRQAYILMCRRSVAIRKMVLERILPKGHYTDCGLRHTPQSFCEGGLFACAGVLA